MIEVGTFILLLFELDLTHFTDHFHHSLFVKLSYTKLIVNRVNIIRLLGFFVYLGYFYNLFGLKILVLINLLDIPNPSVNPHITIIFQMVIKVLSNVERRPIGKNRTHRLDNPGMLVALILLQLIPNHQKLQQAIQAHFLRLKCFLLQMSQQRWVF